MNPVIIRSLNYTTVPNDFIDIHMRTLSPPAIIVYITVCRKTIGWNKETDSISVSQIMEITGLSKNTVINCLKDLVSREFLIREEFKIGNVNLPNKYNLNLDGFLHKVENYDACMQGGGAGEGRGVVQTANGGVVQETHPQKKVLNKDKEKESLPRVKKKESIKSPILFEKFWDSYGKKTNKAGTIREWNKLSTDDQQVAVSKVPDYVKLRPDPVYRKDPERYLKHRVFEDEILNIPKQPAFKDYV